MSYTYEHPHPAATTDIVVFTVRDGRLKVLLVRRAGPPFEGEWALPGGFVGIDEGLDAAARRELMEETGLHTPHLEQFHAFGAPDRDPRERVISIAYLAVLPRGVAEPRGGGDAREARWHDTAELPKLAFDHGAIVDMAMRKLVEGLDDPGFAFDALPQSFTLAELREVYEAALGHAVDERRFRARMLASNLLEGLPKAAPDGARLYCARHREPVVHAR